MNVHSVLSCVLVEVLWWTDSSPRSPTDCVGLRNCNRGQGQTKGGCSVIDELMNQSVSPSKLRFALNTSQHSPCNSYLLIRPSGARGTIVLKALCHKPEGRGFNSRLGHWVLSILHNSSSRTMALGSTQRLKEMSTKNLIGNKALPARKAVSTQRL
jgi:hypothetical protein